MADFLCRFAGIVALTLLSPMALPQQRVDNAWTVLQSGLSDKNAENRSMAVRLLGMLTGNAKAPAFAIKALSDDKPEVREAATDALDRLETKSAIPELTSIVQSDSDAAVVLGAARALIAMGDPLGYGVFYAVLTGEKKSGAGLLEDQKKMLKDPKKIAQFGFEQSVGFVPFGGISLGLFKSLAKDDVSPARVAAAKILAADPDPKSLAALEAACRDDSWLVRVAAIAAIAQRNDLTTFSTIEMHMDDSKEAVRYTAAAAIIHLSDAKNAKPESTIKRKTKRAAKH